jgi:hypothetical protein
LIDMLLNGSSSIWCMWRRLFRSGTTPHSSHTKPRSSIISFRRLSNMDAEGRLYSIPCLYEGFSDPDRKDVGGGLRFLLSDNLCRLSSLHTLRRLSSATLSALAFAFSFILAMASGECRKPFRPWPLTYLFHRRRDLLQDTRSPHPHSHNGASFCGTIFRGEGLPFWLCPLIYCLPGFTGRPQPHAHNCLSVLDLSMSILYHEYENNTIGGER